MPRFTAPSSDAQKFESDRDVFHFPDGGVFGQPRANRDRSPDGRTLHMARQIESQLDDMRHQISDLAHQVDDVLNIRDFSSDNEWTPPAA